VTGASPELSPAVLLAGDIWALKHQKVAAVVIKDSAVIPATVPALNYSVDADYGNITILNPGSFVLPFKAEYTYAASDTIAFFSQSIQEVAMRFEGVNTADNNAKVLVEIYRVALSPTKELGLITNDFGKFTIEGDALVDPTKADDLIFGRFGRLTYV
jgi:hypothetical protein